MSKADDDARPLRQIVLDSDWRLACALASSTDTDPLIGPACSPKACPLSSCRSGRPRWSASASNSTAETEEISMRPTDASRG